MSFWSRSSRLRREQRHRTKARGQPAVYVKPVLQRYSDYQELLLLDPIHEVLESAGWPVAKPDTGTQPRVE